jgi:hypothetical protein
MSDPIIPIKKIKQHARQAFDCGEHVDACPYEDRPDMAAIWKEAFHARYEEFAQECFP